eukprot:257077_1
MPNIPDIATEVCCIKTECESLISKLAALQTKSCLNDKKSEVKSLQQLLSWINTYDCPTQNDGNWETFWSEFEKFAVTIDREIPETVSRDDKDLQCLSAFFDGSITKLSNEIKQIESINCEIDGFVSKLAFCLNNALNDESHLRPVLTTVRSLGLVKDVFCATGDTHDNIFSETVRMDRADLIQRFSEMTEDRSILDRAGKCDTPLILAIQMNLPGSLRCLIKNGSNVNKKNASGITPLMVACDLGRVRIVQQLPAWRS